MAGYFSGSTLRGDIHVAMSGNRWRGSEFAALTQMGSADLQLPAEYSAALQLETRNGKVVSVCLTHATGTAEPEAAMAMLNGLPDGAARRLAPTGITIPQRSVPAAVPPVSLGMGCKTSMRIVGPYLTGARPATLATGSARSFATGSRT